MRIGLALALGARAGTPGGWTPIAGASVDLDFRNRQYYWGGAPKGQADFTSFSLSGGCSHGSDGVILDGTAGNFDVSVSTATLGISFPCALIAKFTPAVVDGTGRAAASIGSGTLNYTAVGLHTNNGARVYVLVSGGAQAALINTTLSAGIAYTVGGNIETNNVLQSINGSTGAAADTSATLPSITALTIGETVSGGTPFNGTVHRVVVIAGALTQAALNNYTAALHAA